MITKRYLTMLLVIMILFCCVACGGIISEVKKAIPAIRDIAENIESK